MPGLLPIFAGMIGATIPTRTYKVRPGDTLLTIAAKNLGSWRRWTEIRDLNDFESAASDLCVRAHGGDYWDWIFPDQELQLPAR